MSKTIKKYVPGSNGHGRSLCGNGFRATTTETGQLVSCLRRHMQRNQAL